MKHFDDISNMQMIIQKIYRQNSNFDVFIEQTNELFMLFLVNSITDQ